MYNPRHPHTLKVLRARKDSDGEIVTDEYGNAIYDVVPLALVKMNNGDPVFGADGRPETTSVESIPYGYRTDSMNTKLYSDVVVSDYKLSLPMFVTELKHDDIIELTDYIHTFKCFLVKQATHNWGSNIWCNDIKN